MPGAAKTRSDLRPLNALGGIEEVPEVAELLRADAEWWRAAFLKDGLPAARTTPSASPPRACAAALAFDVAYVTQEELVMTAPRSSNSPNHDHATATPGSERTPR
ncbi:hypothetical protein GCM10020220_085870 [Nonomuraea rubra]|uniref:hypothetical protein n=1 Tax=Nonomuraea rubra TaxID=46180 RepID=UPI0031E64F4D